MNEDVQRYLAGQVAMARARLARPADAEEHQRAGMLSFSGGLNALRGTNAITAEEHDDWTNRMLVALGQEPMESLPDVGPNTAVMRAVAWSSDTAPMPPPPAPPVSRFLRVIPGPDVEVEVSGGRARVLAIEMYDNSVAITWRLAPKPDFDPLHAFELAATERDTEGLPPRDRDRVRDIVRRGLERNHLQQIGLTDDVGTEYNAAGSGWSGGMNEMHGRATFWSAVPDGASELYVELLGARFEARIA